MLHYDVAVVGGGLVGAAIAYGMAKGRDRRICLLDEGDIAYRASRANFALVWVQGKGHGAPAYSQLTRRAADLWPIFAQELQEESGVDISFQQPGGFTLALSPEELSARAKMLAEIQAPNGVKDLGCQVLDRTEIARIIPQIGPEVAGGTFCPHDGHCNSPKLLLALHVGFQHRGGKTLSGHGVNSITSTSHGFRLTTPGGVVEARQIVLAAGLGNARLGSMVDIEAPLAPKKGQILITEKMAPFLHYPLVNIRQTNEGGVMIGSSNEEVGYDIATRVDVATTIAQKGVRLLPCLADANIVRSWAGLRVMTPDGLPLYDRSPTHPGVVLCSCHSGVTLASFHALEIGPFLAQGVGETSFEPHLTPFSAERFRVREIA